MRIKLVSRLVLVFGIALAMVNGAYAAYPDSPVRIIVGFPPGGGTDIIARLLAERLGASLGGSFIIVNKPGAGAMLGADFVAKSPPNGYTLLLGTAAELTISPPLYGNAPYDPVTAFTPVSVLGETPILLLANPAFPGKDIRDVVLAAKKSPGKITIATGGTGTAPDLAIHQLKTLAGIDFVIAPYKGAGPSVIDAVAGHVPLVAGSIAATAQFIENKTLKPLAIISTHRSTLVPDVPSTAELGLKNYSAVTWFGLFGPAGTPSDVVLALHNAVSVALSNPDVQKRFKVLGFEPAAATASATALTQRIRDEIAQWAEVIKVAKIKME